MTSARFVTFLGAGPNEATARFGAAKLFEASQQIALATNVEEWAHEEYFITRPGDPVVVVAPTGAARDRAWEILSELEFIRADATVVSDVEPPGRAGAPAAGRRGARGAQPGPGRPAAGPARLPPRPAGRQAQLQLPQRAGQGRALRHHPPRHPRGTGMTDRQPLADIAAEAGQVLAGCAAHQVSAQADRRAGRGAAPAPGHAGGTAALLRRHRHRDRPQGGPGGPRRR